MFLVNNIMTKIALNVGDSRLQQVVE